MANLSDLFPADTKRGRLAELLYQRSIAQPEPQPDIRSTPPQIMGGLLGMIDSAKRRVGKNLSELVNNPDQYLRLIAERLPETAQKMASDPGNFIGGGMLGTVGKVGKTQYELAHEVAQRNAALPLEQGGLGLSPTNTAMERARAMGFDTPAYHGTASEVQAFDLGKAGTQMTKDWGDAAYLTPSTSNAEYYATQAGAKAAKDKAFARFEDVEKAEKAKGYPGWGWNDNIQNALNDFRASAKQAETMPEGANVLPLMLQSKQMEPYLVQQGMTDAALNKTLRLAENKKSIAKVMDNSDSVSEYAVFDPSRIRSRFAAFDPFRRNESDLLAGIAPYAIPGVTLGALLRMSQQEQAD